MGAGPEEPYSGPAEVHSAEVECDFRRPESGPGALPFLATVAKLVASGTPLRLC